jgi:signal recognition particle subunit SRP54
MGDVLSLIEKAETALDEKRAEELERRLKENKFDLNDLLMQMEEMKKMGSMRDLLAMIPGVGKRLKDVDIDERAFDKTKAIIYSMTPKERAKPEIINPSRKRRIAAGCGMQVEDVNRLLKQYKDMQKMFKQFGGSKGGKKKMRRMMPNMQGMPGAPMGGKGFPGM